MKKFFAVICAASAAACAVLSFSACGSAEVVFTLGEDGSHYVLSEVSGNPSALTSYEIPAVYDDGVHGELPVTEIGTQAFMNCSLTSVTIPDSVTVIGDMAFAYTSLLSIDIPESVTHIGIGAFAWCIGLTYIVVPQTVRSIGNYAFAYCSSLVRVSIEAEIESLGFGVLMGNVAQDSSGLYINSHLETISLPSTLKEMDRDSISGNFVKDIYFAGTAAQWKAIKIFYYETKENSDGEEEAIKIIYTDDQVIEYFSLPDLTIHCADATLVYSGGQIEEQ